MLEYNNIHSKKWPYPVDYEKENEVNTDVLIIGGGIAGSHAAINAAKRGAKVAVVDKAMVIRSGAGGAGVDHWHGALKNPCSRISPDELMEVLTKSFNDYYLFEWGNGLPLTSCLTKAGMPFKTWRRWAWLCGM